MTTTSAEARIVPAATVTHLWNGDRGAPQSDVQEAVRATPLVRDAVIGAENGEQHCDSTLFLKVGFGLAVFIMMFVYWFTWSPYA